eukprot:TRINITY_DN3188_c0_g1_i2.p1 TRINITY_DN3188_c0_g1~~TRINITY_DN3188_c0_g1_i2.p1  ORF type:complete len:549 (-),score=75.56 TRINITY_DN3188_c0_g1_i2:117-1763(-)
MRRIEFSLCSMFFKTIVFISLCLCFRGGVGAVDYSDINLKLWIEVGVIGQQNYSTNSGRLLVQPTAVAVSTDYVWVIANDNSQVLGFNKSALGSNTAARTTPIVTINGGKKTDIDFRSSDNTLWFTEYNVKHVIQSLNLTSLQRLISLNGAIVLSFTRNASLFRNYSITTKSDFTYNGIYHSRRSTGFVYLPTNNLDKNNYVVVSNLSSSFLVGTGEARGTSYDNFDYPDSESFAAYGAVEDCSSGVWISDTDNNRIVRFRGNVTSVHFGQPTISSSGSSSSPLGLNKPMAVEIEYNSCQKLWVADSNNNRIIQYNISSSSSKNPAPTAYLGQSANNSNAAGVGAGKNTNGNFNYPVNLAWDYDTGVLWIADQKNNRVIGGQIVSFFPSATPTPSASHTVGVSSSSTPSSSPSASPSISFVPSPSPSICAPNSICIDGSLYINSTNPYQFNGTNLILTQGQSTSIGGCANFAGGLNLVLNNLTNGANQSLSPIQYQCIANGFDEVILTNGDEGKGSKCQISVVVGGMLAWFIKSRRTGTMSGLYSTAV